MSPFPDDFRLAREFDQIMRAFAPIYLRLADSGGVDLGFRIEVSHCNPRGHCHGGVWATMADVLMGLNVGLLSGMGGPTVSLSIDFVGAAHAGQWIEGSARMVRQTPRLGFADCLFTADGEPALRASAIFRRKFPGLAFTDMLASSAD